MRQPPRCEPIKDLIEDLFQDLFKDLFEDLLRLCGDAGADHVGGHLTRQEHEVAMGDRLGHARAGLVAFDGHRRVAGLDS